MARAYIGTSGWNYREWRGDFFPADLPARQWLAFYASRFDSVEVNYTFYRLPSVEICEEWYRQTPGNFRFAIKASRFITHVKRLRDAKKPWNIFLGRIRTLKRKLGPILLQFPSTFRASEENLERVDQFLDLTKRGGSPRLALEFRDQSCFGPAMLAVLRRYRAALVISQSSRYPAPEATATANFVYFRFHGPTKMFTSSYSDAELGGWAKVMRGYLGARRDIYAYFNNDSGGHAPRNAAVLSRICRPAVPA